ncbi:cytolytic toxin-beta-like [Cyprinus carpio]|uniref:Cytolytic toxin-beta-like n=1 Tax=Cyprinus carpio TaxID=7962 RepID=A0A9Q9XA18_CYPCA|nr:cytolytic toxin-beta-like [Cyprinus carpio]
MASVGVDVIETAALGRPFQLGMLYDCRKDALIPGITLWDPEKLQQSLGTRPQINTDFKVTASDSIEDKSRLLNIDGSLKLSLLGGLVSVTGAAKYLNDTKKSFRQQRLTLHYHSTCRFEELTMSHLAPENIIHQLVFDNDTATHVVTAVLYGADACFVFWEKGKRACGSCESLGFYPLDKLLSRSFKNFRRKSRMDLILETESSG